MDIGMKIDLDALERALIGSAMGLTFRECQTLIKYARALESRASNAGGAVAFDPWFNEQIKSGNLLSYEDAKAGWDGFAETQTTVTGGTVNLDLTGLSTHPAPASKEPVVDERAAFESAYVEHMNTQEIHSYIGARDYTGEEIASLREGQNYGFDRSHLNGCWAGWQARAALATAQTVPNGWKLIPLLATPEMVEAFRKAYKDGSIWNERLVHALRAMLAAAPAKPEGV